MLNSKLLGILRDIRFFDLGILTAILGARLLASSFLSVPTKNLVSQCTNFHEILYMRIFRKPLEKMQFLLRSDKNTGYVKWRLKCSYDISLNSSSNKKYFRQNWKRKSKPHFIFNTLCPKIVSLVRKNRKTR
jgi:hypothetical protein